MGAPFLFYFDLHILLLYANVNYARYVSSVFILFRLEIIVIALRPEFD